MKWVLALCLKSMIQRETPPPKWRKMRLTSNNSQLWSVLIKRLLFSIGKAYGTLNKTHSLTMCTRFSGLQPSMLQSKCNSKSLTLLRRQDIHSKQMDSLVKLSSSRSCLVPLVVKKAKNLQNYSLNCHLSQIRCLN